MTIHEQYREDLALLAAGALTAEEAVEVQSHLADCADCREEFAELRHAMSQAGIALGGAAPPAHLRARVMDQVIRAPKPASAEKKVWRSWTWAPVAAALVFAALALVNWRRAQELKAENHQLAQQAQNTDALVQRSRALLNTLTAPDALHVTLTATGKPVPPDAKAIYSSRQHALVLTANNLAPVPPNRAYQLWLLPEKGAPVPYGTFKPDSHGNAVMVMTALEEQSPKGFAITIEAEGGSPVPTSPILLIGSL